MIVVTAGHIDHGKTTLVKALTGVDADRLPEEKARGITLDLGFAYARRGDRTLGFVDVPGHERLVRTMVAGATGVAFALLAVAADDGVMPQTREHIAILDLLGLGHGVVAVTKSDTVDPARLVAVRPEIRAALTGTGLADAPIVACSSLSGAGIPELAALLDAAAATPAVVRPTQRGFRLAVDRSFTISGVGIVVTGAVHAGTVRVGDRLLASPGGQEVRVRGIRAEDLVTDEAGTGQRCALNIVGPRLSKGDIHRGDWILAPALHGPTLRLDVTLRLLPSEKRALRHRTPVQVHHGAGLVTGRILLPEGVVVEPGGSARAQIALDAGLGALHGDRFILRDISASRTVGGGTIIDIDGPRRGAWWEERQAMVRALDRADDGHALDGLLEASPVEVDLGHFARSRNVSAAAMDALADTLGVMVVETPRGPLGFSRTRMNGIRSAVLALLDDTHRIEPDNPGLSQEEVAAGIPTRHRRVLPPILDALVRDGTVARRGNHHYRPGHVVRLSPEDALLHDEIRTILEAAGLDQPRLAELAQRVGSDPDTLRGLLDRLGRIGWLQRISKHYYILPSVLIELADHARAVAGAHPEALLTVGQFREATGIGRNITMPILEYFDAQGLTMRVAEGRRVRQEAFTPNKS
ncbi:selenocysteine-specific translation elongation factor [Methylobacterium sp. WL7]|uniref:selenocysteine-specific translation elongation factor n=1 Tax=Methylobacterium sp. WL7 TaxID=2603900 RepID=UPI0011CB0B3C|nr:selenocysteine-specific translation elongation factor [Methylobacterium sp. WL7]TXN43822.1 selenocysteine-specific translation elongation factor [Methylobacterium sp. WL7]